MGSLPICRANIIAVYINLEEDDTLARAAVLLSHIHQRDAPKQNGNWQIWESSPKTEQFLQRQKMGGSEGGGIGKPEGRALRALPDELS